MSRVALSGLLLGLCVLGPVGCSNPNPTPDATAQDAPTFFDATIDQPTVGDVLADVQFAGERCASDRDCDDGLYCNGRERCSAGVCTPGTRPCVDAARCTLDMCDEDNDRCSTVRDDAMCSDGNACNGLELCNPRAPLADPRTGCVPVQPENMLDCDDANTCTIDSCDLVAGCVHSPRDLDGDGFVDRGCTVTGLPGGMQGTDCNDTDSLVYPGAMEDCFDGRDNNCNGQSDFFDADAMCRPSNDTCNTARVLPGAGAYSLSLTGLTAQHSLSCNPLAGVTDAVFSFRVERLQDVRLSLSATENGAAIAVASACDPMNFRELSCARAVTMGVMAASPALLLRSVAPGLYYVIVQAPTAGPHRLTLRFEPPSMAPPADACPPLSPARMLSVGDGVAGPAAVVSLPGLSDDFGLSCNPALPRIDGMLGFSLAQTRNVTLSVSAVAGVSYVSVRRRGGLMGVCPGSQLRCQATPSSASFAITLRDLPADEYYLVLENAVDSDVSVTAMGTDPAVRAPGDVCRTAVPVIAGGMLPWSANASVDFSSLLVDADHGTPCGSNGMPVGWRDGVASLTVAEDSDLVITVTPTGPWAPSFRWALQSMCGVAGSTVGRCLSAAGPSPNRLLGVPAGQYAVMIEAQTAAPAGAGFRVDVAASSPAMRPQHEACPGANIPLTPSGADLIGGITVDPALPVINNSPDHGTACGSMGAAGSGFTDVVYNFTIPDTRTVVVELRVPAATTWFYELQDRCATMSPLRCRSTAQPALSARLNPGTYSVVAEVANGFLPRGPITVLLTASP